MERQQALALERTEFTCQSGIHSLYKLALSYLTTLNLFFQVKMEILPTPKDHLGSETMKQQGKVTLETLAYIAGRGIK